MNTPLKIFDINKKNSICIQENILSNQAILKKISSLGYRIALITDQKVASLYGANICSILENEGINVEMIVIGCGEESKTRETKEWIEDQLIRSGHGRDSIIIALGGGVVTDIAGFVASTYCRGLPLIMMPTTLLGMVDASIGGKNGVNAGGRKNCIGSFYLPEYVLIDPLFLQTLPFDEYQQGLVETIKHSIIHSESFFSYLESTADEFIQKKFKTLRQTIFESCCIKQNIVDEDAKEFGKRALLNFGHTIGHAIESLSCYQIRHGTAVAIGMLVEAFISKEMGYLNPQSFHRIQLILKKYQLKLDLNPFPVEELMKVMKLDKKSLKMNPRFVLLQNIGSPLVVNNEYCFPVDQKTLENAIDWMNDDLCHN